MGDLGAAMRLAESEGAVALLSRYPVRWGQCLVILREHAVTLTEVDGEAFADAARLAHRVGVALETTLKPARCYVAALGTAEDGVPMTFRHLHFNVIPVPEIDARPRQVLTWAHGIYDGDPSEWDEICTSLRRALR
jgi:diadenosine tetraphosphate (Ap4A) HIT family hydrolase